MSDLRLTTRGKVVVAVLVTATTTALLIWWGHIVAQHDRAIFQQCMEHKYECMHPDTWKPGTYIPNDKD